MKKEKIFNIFVRSSSTLFTAFVVDSCLLLIAAIINLITGFVRDTKYMINIITEMLHFGTVFETEFLIVLIIYGIVYFALFLKYGKEFSDYVKAHNKEDY